MGITLSLNTCDSRDDWTMETESSTHLGQKRKHNGLESSQKKRTIELIITKEVGKHILHFFSFPDVLSVAWTSSKLRNCDLIKKFMSDYLGPEMVLWSTTLGPTIQEVNDNKWTQFLKTVHSTMWYKTNPFGFEEEFPLVIFNFPPSQDEIEISFSVDENNSPVRTLVTIGKEEYLDFCSKYIGSFDNRFINYIHQKSNHIRLFNSGEKPTLLRLLRFSKSGLGSSNDFLSATGDCEGKFKKYEAILNLDCSKQQVLSNFLESGQIRNISIDGGIEMAYDFENKKDLEWVPRMITETSCGFQALFLNQISCLYGQTKKSEIIPIIAEYKSELSKVTWFEDMDNPDEGVSSSDCEFSSSDDEGDEDVSSSKECESQKFQT
jgi:hypothetical protein